MGSGPKPVGTLTMDLGDEGLSSMKLDASQEVRRAALSFMDSSVKESNAAMLSST
jgi:hypothetical protein